MQSRKLLCKNEIRVLLLSQLIQLCQITQKKKVVHVIKHDAMKYAGVEVQLQILLTSEQYGR